MHSAPHSQSVMISTPTLDGNLDARYVAALLQTTDSLRKRRIPYEITFELGNSLIADARNRLCSTFLKSPHSDMVFIDADIVWQPDDFMRLLSHPVPFVAAVYQRKSRDVSFTVKFGKQIERRGELLTADCVGTGFMRLSRECLEALANAHPEWRIADAKSGANELFYALFDTGILKGEYVGEDYMFCHRWRELGGEVLIDPTIRLAHYGSHAFDQPLQNYLVRNGGTDAAREESQPVG